MASIQERDRALLIKIGIAFGLIVALSVGALITNWMMGRNLKELESQQLATKQTIQSQASQEISYLTFVEKLKVLSKLFADRKGKQEALAFFRNLFSDDVKIAGLQYVGEDRQLLFSIRANSIFTLDQVFDVLGSDQVKTKYPKIEKKGLRRSGDGSYSLQATVQVGEEEIGS